MEKRKVYLYDDQNYEYIDVEDYNFNKDEIIDEYSNLAFHPDSIEPIDESELIKRFINAECIANLSLKK